MSDYVVVDGMGWSGVVRFHWNGCVAALRSPNPWRELDVASAIAAAPERQRTELAQVCRLPLLAESAHQTGITAILWSDGDRIEGGEPWRTSYAYGADLLSREMLDDSSWTSEGAGHWGLESDAVSAIISIATTRARRTGPLIVGGDDFERIVPRASAHRGEAIEMLSELGIMPA